MQISIVEKSSNLIVINLKTAKAIWRRGVGCALPWVRAARTRSAVSFGPKIVMRCLLVVAGPRFLADRGSGDGASRRNARFPPALVAATQEYLESDRFHKRSR